MTLQAALEEMENLFKTSKDKKVNIKTVMDDLVMGIKTLLDIIIITLQNRRESN